MTINWEPTGTNVYFFEPHQDDGSLFMAQAAAHHVLAERTVHVVLMSNGSTSNVRRKLNGEIHTGPWWGGFHDPEHEGYDPFPDTPAGRREFGLRRTEEWSRSWLQLGVPIERQHFGIDLASSADLPDAISVDYASTVFQYWMNRDLSAGLARPGFYTMHWEDSTADHAACGTALRTLRLEDARFADSRWMVRLEQEDEFGAPYGVPATLLPEVKAMQKRSAFAYAAWAPDADAFAIGMQSVSGLFETGPLAGKANQIVRFP